MTEIRRVELREWTRAWVGQLEEADLAALQRLQGRLGVEAVPGGHLVQATSFVGLVRLAHLEIHVSPKLAGGELGLVRLLEWTSGVGVLESSQPAARLLELGGASLVDLIGLQLVQATEAVVKRGLLGDYVEEDAALPAVRGRILIRRQLLERHGRVDQVWCRHDDLLHDVPENRVLAIGLRVAIRRCQDAGVVRRARALLQFLAAVCDTDDATSARDLPAIAYHRLNAHYRWGHELTRVLVEGDGVSDLLHGQRRCAAFLLDMNRLFERFVEKLMRQLARSKGVTVVAQARDASIVRDAQGAPYGSIRPDLLLTWPGAPGPARRQAVDAKYKPFDRGVGSGDLYQAFLYAFAYADTGKARAMLIYPAPNDQFTREEIYVRAGGGRGDAHLTAVAVPVSKILEEARAVGPNGPLISALWNALEPSVGQALS